MPHVVCVHLLNDFSGSPRVLAEAIGALRKAGADVDLFTSDTEGCLSNVDARTTRFHYRRSNRRWLTLAAFALSQARLAWALLRRYRDQQIVMYINTLLPFGGALAGKMLGARVVYHVHETSLRPRWFKAFLTGVARFCATRQVFVSRFLLRAEGSPTGDNRCVYNPVPHDLAEDAASYDRGPPGSRPFRVLMLCSLRDYKGIPEYVLLARRLESRTDIRLDLVVNGSTAEVSQYFQTQQIPPNLDIHPACSDVRDFYRRASLVVNLSRPEEWVETFGLTLLEGMAYGVPAIAPPAGGPLEIVEDGRNGFLVRGDDTDRLVATVLRLATDRALFRELSSAARERAGTFSVDRFARGIVEAVLE